MVTKILGANINKKAPAWRFFAPGIVQVAVPNVKVYLHVRQKPYIPSSHLYLNVVHYYNTLEN
jgi:hypothetical protein